MLCWSSKYSVAKNLSFISCLCKDHAGYFQESGLAPNQLQGRLMNVVFLCVSEETVMNTSIISASFFFFFFLKLHLKISRLRLRAVIMYLWSQSYWIAEQGYKIPSDSKGLILHVLSLSSCKQLIVLHSPIAKSNVLNVAWN